MNILIYLLQVNLYLLLFYLFYFALLRNETFFKTNRFYLVGSALLSLCIPLLKTECFSMLFITEKVQNFTQMVAYKAVEPTFTQTYNPSVIVAQQVMFNSLDWIWLIYLSVTVALLVNFLRKLYIVRKLLSTQISGQAFSFFGRISVDQNLEGKETITSHEMVHARQWHSADVVFFEILLALNWFNPVIYFYRKAIQNIHEFIADELAASTLEDRSAYALLLVSNVFNTQPQQLTNNFFNQSLLKRRLIMLNKTKSRKVAILKYGLSVPLFAGMIVISSALGVDAQITQVITNAIPGNDGLSKIQLKSNLGTPGVQVESINSLENTNKPVSVSSAKTPQPTQDQSNGQPEKTSTFDDFKQPAQKLQEYIRAFFKGRGAETKFGKVWFSFDVNNQKHVSNFKIISSAGFSWEDELLQYLDKFKDTVGLAAGTYRFFESFEFSDDDIKAENYAASDKDGPKFAFGNSNTTRFHHTVSDETKKEAGKIVEYIRVDYLTNPIILVDGKEVAYTMSEQGFKLAETIYPKKVKINVFKGDKAVSNYNESARQGLIVVKTGEAEK